MIHSPVNRAILGVVCTAALSACFVNEAAAMAGRSPLSLLAVKVTDEWTFDDIKDVCEAFKFVMVSVGIGCGLYWYFRRYIPAQAESRLELDIAFERGGETDSMQFVEIVAVLHNAGGKPALLNDLRFRIHTVSSKNIPPNGGVLACSSGLEPMIEENWLPTAFTIDPRSQRRCAIVVAIPTVFAAVVVTTTLTCHRRCEPYSASKLLWLQEPIP